MRRTREFGDVVAFFGKEDSRLRKAVGEQ